jgi:flagellar assembly factor FliW
MKYETSAAGGVTVPPDEIIRFQQGIPAFEELRLFTLVDVEAGAPFKLLQSLEKSDVSLVVANPFVFYPEYDFVLPESVQDELGINSEQEVEVWSVITVSSDVSKTTINLLAPLVINHVTKIGKQHLLHDSEYGPRHPLLRPAAEQATGEPKEG